jgi:putative nucleotidyltransferase with HDIG domain
LERFKVEGIAMNMAKSTSDVIPSREECEKLMVQHSMRPNIVDHSIQVMNISTAITDNLKNGVSLNRNLVIAAALLHDITKTRSLETNERHDISGGELLRKMGFTSVAEIVEQHIIFQNFNPQGRLEEREIIFYTDKRVNHDKIVTIDERVHYLIQRYGDTEEIRNQIFRNKNLVLAVESKISDFMKIDINRAIEEIKAG